MGAEVPQSGRAGLPDVGVLVAAAGKGERSGRGEPKQFREVAGVPMLLRAIRPFAQLPRVRQIIVALPAPYVTQGPSWLTDLASERLKLVAGGQTRAQSVRAALAALDPGCSLVLVHDAARPFVAVETVLAVIETASEGVGAVAGVPLADTLKRVNGETGRIVETVDRRGLFRAQTPQGFPRSMLEDAYRESRPADIEGFTDESALVEAAGYAVRLVPDRSDNIKVTSSADFALAGSLAGP